MISDKDMLILNKLKKEIDIFFYLYEDADIECNGPPLIYKFTSSGIFMGQKVATFYCDSRSTDLAVLYYSDSHEYTLRLKDLSISIEKTIDIICRKGFAL